ncbi:MAG: hypothetical protein JWM36_1496 [Hyphomicrobiales bacterium]|nr:hypothetical protein [Hyphomicrobiales bacterium]
MSALIEARAEPLDLAPITAPFAPSLLRFITCGSVDDGKSTLIGRLLYDSNVVLEDQLSALERDSRKFGTQGENLDFALLVDGLSAEREQGITIDVAYRYFATSARAFIVADTPGHEQYTRNMATGASTAELAVILVDARKGILAQTRRHSFIVSMLGVRHVIVAINKMDLVGFSRVRFEEIVADYRKVAATLGFASVTCIPISARDGDNVAARSTRTDWYDGPVLLSHLESIDTTPPEARQTSFRMPVQWVNRPSPDFRGYAGTVASGTIGEGDEITVLPNGRRSRVARIVTGDGDIPLGSAGQALTLTLEDEIDISRGDVIVSSGDSLMATRLFAARLLWMVDQPLAPGADYILKLATSDVRARISSIRHAIDIHSFAPHDAKALAMNEIGLVAIGLDGALPLADYRDDRTFGGFILIDRISHATVAIGFVDLRVDAAFVAPAVEAKGAGARLRALAGKPGSRARAQLWQKVSWRIASSALLGLLVARFTGSSLLGVTVGVADAALRPLLSLLHGCLWDRFGKPGVDLNEGGAGI